MPPKKIGDAEAFVAARSSGDDAIVTAKERIEGAASELRRSKLPFGPKAVASAVGFARQRNEHDFPPNVNQNRRWAH